MIVLVCGGRDFDNAPRLSNALTYFHKAYRFSLVIHGAARGADTLAGKWATANGIQVREFPADWDKDGKAAGPMRNARMISDGKPDLVIAFEGGVGTADMLTRARKAGLRVLEA